MSLGNHLISFHHDIKMKNPEFTKNNQSEKKQLHPYKNVMASFVQQVTLKWFMYILILAVLT